MKEYPCDICGNDETAEVPHCREYTGGEAVNICKGCGFVYVKKRRTAEEIARYWSEQIYGSEFTASTYTPRIPAVRARHVYVAEFADINVGLKGKELCDLGAGEGQFLEIIRDRYQARVFGIEHSKANCELLKKNGIESFNGKIEDFASSPEFKSRRFDVLSVMWTLVNCHSCKDFLSIAREIVKGEGHIVVAEGSRILVPFKKPLQMYFSKLGQDLHAFHFSFNAMRNLLSVCGFEVVHSNRYLDSDVLAMIAKPKNAESAPRIERDDWKEVAEFFERWHLESKHYRANHLA